MIIFFPDILYTISELLHSPDPQLLYAECSLQIKLFLAFAGSTCLSLTQVLCFLIMEQIQLKSSPHSLEKPFFAKIRYEEGKHRPRDSHSVDIVLSKVENGSR